MCFYFLIITHLVDISNKLNIFKMCIHINEMGGDLMDKKREEIIKLLPKEIRKLFMMSEIDFSRLQEIRLRVNMPLIVVYGAKEYFISYTGKPVSEIKEAYRVTCQQIKEAMVYISSYSRYAFEDEIRQGFITVEGGHRVGVAGRIIWDGGKIKSITYISFINIRISHEVIGCSDSVIGYLYNDDSFYNTLIISPPRCGKTTLLRDIVRSIANGNAGSRGRTVGIVDERSEISACHLGCPQNNIGCRTDVLDGCPKSEGMMMLVRSMSPEIVAVDEIGSREDAAAIDYVMNCGINIIATVHGLDMDEVINKPVIGELVRKRMFKRYILLKKGMMGKISAVFDDRGNVIY